VANFEDQLRAAAPQHISISAPLGAGGQGTVFRGTCNASPAAIKVFTPATDARRIDRECQLLSALNCPYVVRILEHFPVTVGTERLRIVVYEYHDGGDLTAHLQTATPQLTEKQLLSIGHQVGMGIATLWASRIVHRDIKPANIVRADDGRHVLVDVGFARHLDLSDITAAGGAPGTRGFRSPEQAKGRRSLTIHSDVFSLGVTLYYLALKRHPFMNADLMIPTPVNIGPLSARSLSPGFVRLIQQMLEFTPAKRPSDLESRFSALGAT
jgi:eukaryotic-like serine/threonine-protein kinase